jgi:hypothetical protein
MEEDLAKYKYIKYKKKFLELKKNKKNDEMDGGHGTPTIKIDKQRADYDREFHEHNSILKQYIVLDTKIGGTINEISYEYKKMLFAMMNNLMTPINGKINLDFINRFNRNIHVDLTGDYSINGNVFKNPNLNYQIDTTISQGTGGGDIFLLKRQNKNNNLPDELILKIFNDTIDIDQINNYLSLEITRLVDHYSYFNKIVETFTRQQNYITMSKNEYTKYYNFNDNYISVDEFINTNDDNNFKNINQKTYLSTKNNNFTNEILVNLIIENILLKINSDQYDHYIKYYNYFIANVNGTYRGCVIMDKMDGSLDRLLNQINSMLYSDMDYSNKMNAFHDSIVKQIVPSLLVLKTKEYQFTHTDMKAENIFFKEIEVREDMPFDKYFTITINNRTIYYKFYIADFDKSSITYNGIRFYNNYQSSHSAFAGFIFNSQSFYSDFLNFDQTPNSYRMFRTMINLPTEVFAMRYMMFPFFLFFDIQSLCFSLFSYEIKEPQSNYINENKEPKFKINKESEYQQLLTLIFGGKREEQEEEQEELSNVRSIYSKYNIPYHGDFSKLMEPVVVNNYVRIFKPDMRDLFNAYGINETENNSNVKTILISTGQNKLIISLPFIPRDINTASYYTANSIIYVPNNAETKRIYSFAKNEYKSFVNAIFSEGNIQPYYIVDFTGNKAITSASIFNPMGYLRVGSPVAMTNRYTSQGFLYEFDWIEQENVQFIFDIYKDMFMNSLQMQ